MKKELFSTFFEEMQKLLQLAALEIIDECNDKLCVHMKEFFWKNWYKAVCQIPLRILILDIHRQKDAGRLLGNAPEEQYTYYNEVVLRDSQYIKYLCEEYPEMYRLFQIQTKNMAELFKEWMLSLQLHKQEIVRQLCSGSEFFRVVDVDMCIADSHNAGKRVAKVTLDNGITLFYKPRSCWKGIQYQKIYNYLCDKANISILPMNCLDYEKESWEEEICVQMCENQQQVKRYYFRMGIHLALAYVMGVSDLHGENIIAHGEYPIVVDFETFPGYSAIPEGKNAEEDARTGLLGSVLKTGILPMAIWGTGKCATISSALNQTEKIWTPFQLPVVECEGTSDICIGYKVREVVMEQCVLKCNGKAVQSGQYTEDVCTGFQFAYQRILCDRKTLEMLTELYDERTRAILRHTQQYAMYLSASFHPDYCGSEEKRRELLSALYAKETDVQRRSCGIYETESLLQMDIPYFEIDCKTGELFDGTGNNYGRCFMRNLLENLLYRVRRMGTADLRWQMNLIRLSMGMLTGKRMLSDSVFHGNPWLSLGRQRVDAEKQVRRIAKWLCNTAVICQKDITWIGTQPCANGFWSVEPMGLFLYNGISGILVFLELYMRYFKDSQVEETVALIRNKLFLHTKSLESVCDEKNMKTGVMDGEGSLVFSYILLYRLTKKEIYLEYAICQFYAILKHISHDTCYDFISGNAGAIVLALELYKITGDGKYRETAIEIEKILWRHAEKTEEVCGWKLSEMTAPLAGLAHGNGGFILAYSRLYQETGETQYKNITQKLIRYENSLYLEEKRTGLICVVKKQKRKQ